MRVLVILAILGAFIVGGCARHKASLPATAGISRTGVFSEPPAAGQSNAKLIVTPEADLVGKVVSVNAVGRFVVLNFAVGHLPALEQRLSVYHQGLKTGEVKVTGPQQDDNVVADLVAGDAQVGDEVRDK